ncbi:sigma-70 family RNA polymerase sigma factor [Cupriavidus agavae]|uniref:RNA polymerase sigma-70 factor (ECF subfamily) n=1 Tax=Cupriavidus agavae TaxID=1001822 RepID=A0A4Q7RT94_9BURK|nr:sigma-70 family RNA polymerase sigma factor [Cupriavidus agavae]RZT36875.1 RNA polymerase sigma-70 factor (ECF subfamily) [Cupriavidus agavae]
MALTEPAGGSGQAFTSIYRSHHGWLLKLLSRKLGNIESAADLAHDTFARLLHAGDAASLREPRAYLTTVSTRLAADFFRRQALERAYLDAIAGLPEPAVPSPETRALVLEALTAISHALDRLPARVRDIFLLSQVDGLPYRDIAEEMGITVNMVQKAMAKAYVQCCLVLNR